MDQLKAIYSVVIPCPTGLSDVVGYSDDGTPITRQRAITVKPGEIFEIDPEKTESLIEVGAATRDLAESFPWGGADD